MNIFQKLTFVLVFNPEIQAFCSETPTLEAYLEGQPWKLALETSSGWKIGQLRLPTLAFNPLPVKVLYYICTKHTPWSLENPKKHRHIVPVTLPSP